jgi:hypothetical protein
VYITYKTDSDSGVTVKGAVNGTGTFDVDFSTSSKFVRTSTACYGSSTLDDTDDKWKTAELKFDSPSDVNNIYTFQLEFTATSIAVDFEINDMSIVYRAKNVK